MVKRILWILYLLVMSHSAMANNVINNDLKACVDEDESTTIAKLDKLRCLNCKNEYNYDGDIRYEIANDGDADVCVFLGLKRYTEKGWTLYTDSVFSNAGGEAPLLIIKAKGKHIVKWRKKDRDRLTAGGKLILFAWKRTALPNGIHKTLHEFTLLPKNIR